MSFTAEAFSFTLASTTRMMPSMRVVQHKCLPVSSHSTRNTKNTCKSYCAVAHLCTPNLAGSVRRVSERTQRCTEFKTWEVELAVPRRFWGMITAMLEDRKATRQTFQYCEYPCREKSGRGAEGIRAMTSDGRGWGGERWQNLLRPYFDVAVVRSHVGASTYGPM